MFENYSLENGGDGDKLAAASNFMAKMSQRCKF